MDTTTTDRNALIRSSWARVQGDADRFSTTFYDTLFALDPALRPMFRGDMALQRQRLAGMVDAAVRLLDQPDALMPALRGLGQRHGGYGVSDAHYATVGAALLHSLAAAMPGDAFTPALRAAWTDVYGLISSVMMEAAAARPPARTTMATAAARMPAVAALTLAMAAGGAMAAGPDAAFGVHPALSHGPRVTAVGIDPNTFIVGHPASPTTRGGHANDEHPAVLVARRSVRPAIDANTFLVQPPVTVTWRVEPETDDAPRYAQAAAGVVAAQSR